MRVRRRGFVRSQRERWEFARRILDRPNVTSDDLWRVYEAVTERAPYNKVILDELAKHPETDRGLRSVLASHDARLRTLVADRSDANEAEKALVPGKKKPANTFNPDLSRSRRRAPFSFIEREQVAADPIIDLEATNDPWLRARLEEESSAPSTLQDVQPGGAATDG